MPQSCEADYRPWHAAGYEGWVDRVLFDRLDASCRADPGRLLELPGARVVRGARNLTLSAPVAGSTIWLKRFRPKSLVDGSCMRRARARPSTPGTLPWP